MGRALMGRALAGPPRALSGHGPLWAPVPGIDPTVFKLRPRLGLRAYIIRYIYIHGHMYMILLYVYIYICYICIYIYIYIGGNQEHSDEPL